MTALESLRQAVEHMHGVTARFVGSTPVHEQAGYQTVWQGVVSLFDLEDHPTAEQCYAWSVPADQTNPNERFYAVLRTKQIDTPTKAVQASIVAENKK